MSKESYAIGGVPSLPYSRYVPPKKAPHIGHGFHLCHLVENGKTSLTQIKKMVKDAKYICKKCGRVAAQVDNLCEPVSM